MKNKKDNKKSKETYSYRGWLLSDNFFKRVFAVVGYYMVGQIFVSLIIFAMFIFFMFWAMFLSGIINLFSIL